MSSLNKTAEVFELLSKGQFICSNNTEINRRALYAYIEEHYEDLYTHYKTIGFELESGDNYYYFSKENETAQGIELKIEKALWWLDVLAFFTTFRKDIGRGARFTPYEILSLTHTNILLKEQLEGLSRSKVESKNQQEILEKLLKGLQKEGFIALENDKDQIWKVLDAWGYMEQLVMAVNITDEPEEETQQIGGDVE